MTNKKILINIKKLQAQGQYAKAYKLYEYYFARMKDSPEFLNSFGDLCLIMEKRDKAKELWKDAAKKYIDYEYLDEARAVLNKLIRNFPEEKKERYRILLESKNHDFLEQELKKEDFADSSFREVLKSSIKKDPEILKVVAEIFPADFKGLLPSILDEELQSLMIENPVYMEILEPFIPEESLLELYLRIYEKTRDKKYLRLGVEKFKTFFLQRNTDEIGDLLRKINKPSRKILFIEFLKKINLTDSIMNKFMELYDKIEDPVLLLPFLYQGKDSLKKMGKERLKVLRDYLYSLGDLKMSGYVSEIIQEQYNTSEETHVQRISAWKAPVAAETPGKLSVIRGCENKKDFTELGLYSSCYFYRRFDEIRKDLPLLVMVYFPDLNEKNREFIFRAFSKILKSLRQDLEIFDMGNLLMFGFRRMRVGDANLLIKEIDNIVKDGEIKVKYLFSFVELKNISDVNFFAKKLAEVTSELEESVSPSRIAELSTAYLLEGFENIFIDREKELGIILGMNKGIALIEGQTGIGKTCFLEHLFSKLNDTYPVIILRCQEIFSQIPFASLKAAIQDFKSFKSISLQEITQFLGGYYEIFYEYFISPETKSTVSQPDVKFKIFESFYLAIKHFIKDGKGYILVDDIQWIDNASLELLSYVLKRGAKIVLCATYNLELEDGDVLERVEKLFSIRKVPLEPFREQDVKEYFNTLFAGYEVDKETLEKIVEITGGIPLLINDLMVDLVTKNNIRVIGNKFFINLEDIEKVSYADVIDKRFKLLDEFAQEVLRYAACLGRMFRLADLTGIMKVDKYRLLKAIEKAVLKGFLKEMGGHQYDFKFSSAVHYEIVYSSLSHLLKKEIHQEIAQYLELIGGTPERIAEHYLRAENYNKGLDILIQLLTSPANKELVEEYSELLQKCIDLCLDKSLPVDERIRLNFVKELVPLLENAGLYTVLEHILKEFFVSFRNLLDPVTEKELTITFINVLTELGKFKDAEKMLSDKEELFFDDFSQKEFSPIQKAMLRLYIYSGNVMEAWELLEEWEQHLRKDEIYRFLFSKGLLKKIMGKYSEAEEYFQESLRESEARNNLHFIHRNLVELMRLYMSKDEFEDAEQKLTFYFNKYKKFREFALKIKLEKAKLLFHKGDLQNARFILKELVELNNEARIGRLGYIRANELMARIYMEYGFLKKSMELVEVLKTYDDFLGPAGLRLRILLLEKSLAELRGDLRRAEEILKQVEKIEHQILSPSLKIIILAEKIRLSVLKGEKESREKLMQELNEVAFAEDILLRDVKEILSALFNDGLQIIETFDPLKYKNSQRIPDKVNYYLLLIQYLIRREEIDMALDLIHSLRPEIERGFNLKEFYLDFLESIVYYMKGEFEKTVDLIERAQEGARWMGNRFLNLLIGSIREQILLEEEKFEQLMGMQKQKESMLSRYPQLATEKKVFLSVPIIPYFYF